VNFIGELKYMHYNLHSITPITLIFFNEQATQKDEMPILLKPKHYKDNNNLPPAVCMIIWL